MTGKLHFISKKRQEKKEKKRQEKKEKKRQGDIVLLLAILRNIIYNSMLINAVRFC